MHVYVFWLGEVLMSGTKQDKRLCKRSKQVRSYSYYYLSCGEHGDNLVVNGEKRHVWLFDSNVSGLKTPISEPETSDQSNGWPEIFWKLPRGLAG